MRVLVTGCNGMLGKDLTEELAKYDNLHLFGISRSVNVVSTRMKYYYGDLLDQYFLNKVLNEVKPNIIFHLAAIVNLKKCEDYPENAYNLHINVSRRLAESGAYTIYISTDSVFNGNLDSYSVEDIPDPLNQYASTKLLGEFAVRAVGKNNLIVRTNIFGFNNPLKDSIVEWAFKNFDQKKSIIGFDDVYFNAVYTRNLALILVKLMQTKTHGLLHIGSIDAMSKFEFLRLLAKEFEYSQNLVVKGSSCDVDFQIDRPKKTVLNSSKAPDYLDLPTIYSGIQQLKCDYKKMLT